MNNEFTKGLFSMDCVEENIEGFSYGNTWNGWACPYFTKESGLLIAKLMPDFGMTYDEENDRFVAESEYYDRDEWESVVIDGAKYYPIGNCSWCWFDMTKEAV
jgi:hypothetical protein